MPSQSTHNYYTRSSNDATNSMTSTPDDSNPIFVTLDPNSSLETKLLPRFDEVQNEHLNVKNIIMNNLQEENERLRKRVSFSDKKFISLETIYNMLEQYGMRNNPEIIGILDSMPQKDLENKVVDINAIGVNVSNND